MEWLNKLLKFFRERTPEESYKAGQDCVDRTIDLHPTPPTETAAWMFRMASGGFNTTEAHREFDRGVRDRLLELGFVDPDEPPY